MKALLLIALLTQVPKDAPVAELGATVLLDIRPIQVGEPSPLTGRVMDTQSYISLAKRTAGAETERDALRANPPTPLSWPLVGLLCIVAVSGGFWLGWKASSR